MNNINDTYFEGAYKDIWKALIPAEFTAKEVELMLQYFKLQPGDRVLDLMCGYGRHALALAEKGMDVTAVDNLGDYINEIKTKSAEKGWLLHAETQNVAHYEPQGVFDLVICMGNSLNFFDTEHTQKIFRTVSAHLKSGGHLLINSWSIAEIAFTHFISNGWSQIGDIKFLTQSKILFQPTRIETENQMLFSDCQKETRSAVDYIYSLNELINIARSADLTFGAIYSTLGRKEFIMGEKKAYIIFQKPLK